MMPNSNMSSKSMRMGVDMKGIREMGCDMVVGNFTTRKDHYIMVNGNKITCMDRENYIMEVES